jgi:hypothetical protein
MSQLSIIERKKLETLLEMGGGYVLDFSNRTFEEFIAESVELEIYNDKYHHGSGSKANRLRGLIKIESDGVVAKLIRDLIEYAVYLRKELDPNLVADCIAIADRLQRSRSAATASVPVSQSVQQVDAQRVRAFISYSWDSEEHKDWTREFADTLASNGIDIILDQYDLRLGQDRFQFMEHQFVTPTQFFVFALQAM